MSIARAGTNSIQFYTHKVSEVHVDLPNDALLHIAKSEDVEFVILRVQVWGRNGRPASRTLRLHRDMLEEPAEDLRPSFE